MSMPTDEDLLLAVRGGNVESLGVLVSRWEDPLYRFVSRMVDRPDDARDVCQETFLRILRRSDAFREGARFSTWMYQIALNSDDAPPRESAAPETADTHPGTALEAAERRRAVQRALTRLPNDQREVLLLKEYEGLKFREIAEVLEVPESTVKSRMYAALDAMRASLEPTGIR